jgi:hypothetical protein
MAHSETVVFESRYSPQLDEKGEIAGRHRPTTTKTSTAATRKLRKRAHKTAYQHCLSTSRASPAAVIEWDQRLPRFAQVRVSGTPSSAGRRTS